MKTPSETNVTKQPEDIARGSLQQHGSALEWSDADEKAFREETMRCQQEHLEYVKRGICSQCGATCAKEAETKCTQTRMVNDEYTCAGEDLWEDQ